MEFERQPPLVGNRLIIQSSFFRGRSRVPAKSAHFSHRTSRGSVIVHQQRFEAKLHGVGT